jgi:hypothetical protein
MDASSMKAGVDSTGKRFAKSVRRFFVGENRI